MSDATQPPQPKPPKRDPAFPMYADDFLSGTADMSAEEVGAYIRLLCHQWTKGGLPNDEPRLARMAGLIGSPSLGYVLAKFSPCPDGLLRHPRLEAIRAEREAYRTRQADSGAAGARRRWGAKRNDGNPNGDPMATPMANAWPEDSSPSPSPSPSPSSTQGESVGDKPKATRFTPPTREELDFAAAKLGMAPVEVDKFVSYYGSNGWKVGRNPMKSWQHALTRWHLNSHDHTNARPGGAGNGGLTPAERRNATLDPRDVAAVRANAAASAERDRLRLEEDPDYIPI